MASVAILGRSLIVSLGTAGHASAPAGRLEIPLEHVAGAESGAELAHRWLDGVRLGTTHIPGAIAAGWYRTHERWGYWEVRDPARAIWIELHDEAYNRIVVDVDDPDDALTRIREACFLLSSP